MLYLDHRARPRHTVGLADGRQGRTQGPAQPVGTPRVGPPGRDCAGRVGVCLVADRGFGDQNLYRLLTGELHFDYVIRFRADIKVTAASGVTHTAAARVSPSGRARVLRGAMVTADRYPVGTVVCVRDPEMKQAW